MDLNVNLVIILILPNQGSLQTGHLILLSVDQDLGKPFSYYQNIYLQIAENHTQLHILFFSYYMWWFECPYKLAGLLVVCMSRE